MAQRAHGEFWYLEECEANLVLAVNETLLAERVHLEGDVRGALDPNHLQPGTPSNRGRARTKGALEGAGPWRALCKKRAVLLQARRLLRTWLGRSTSISRPASQSSMRRRTCSWGRATGSMPFLKQLLKKMSAKLVLTTQRTPKSRMLQGACSREDPHPKLSPATSTFARNHGARRKMARLANQMPRSGALCALWLRVGFNRAFLVGLLTVK